MFGSEARLLILAELFVVSQPELSITGLARSTGVSQPTVSQEVARLARFGVVTSRHVGRTRLVSANWALPWAQDLAGLLARSVGILAHLAAALSDINGVELAFVFGSWAARFVGEAGPAPRDLDVLVVGSADVTAVRKALRVVGRDTGFEIDAFVVSPKTWATPRPSDALVLDVQAKPVVEVPLAVAA